VFSRKEILIGAVEGILLGIALILAYEFSGITGFVITLLVGAIVSTALYVKRNPPPRGDS
jgi:hypothetical protein